jgi:RNA polymerase sigma-70 factor (ECF subfamily)
MRALTLDPIHSLPTPIVLQLAARGQSVDRVPGETRDDCLDRVDTALMALFRDTLEPQAFEALYSHARGRLFRWVNQLLGERRAQVDPVDLLQDTFVNIYRYSSRFDSRRPSSFRAWARTIAANALRRALGGGRRARLEDYPEGLREPADPRPGPNRQAEVEEEQRRLHESWLLFLEHYATAYAELSERDRAALALVELDGCSYAEAGRLLRVGSSNMKMIMFRSRQRIQRHMGRAMGVEPRPQPRSATAAA